MIKEGSVVHNKDYLYSVAEIRAVENSLLNKTDLEQLINAPDYKSAISLLTEKGYKEPEGSDYSSMLDGELSRVWDMIKESAPDAQSLDAFVLKNDFQNLKAVLKSEVMGYDAKDFMIKPSVIEPETLLDRVGKRLFSELPEFISETAEKAYTTITTTGNGQLCDVIIDRGALEAILSAAQSGGDMILSEYAQMFVLTSDIKTAYRCIKTKKNQAFVISALAECDAVNARSLAEAAVSGEEAFAEYLSSNGLSQYREELEKGTQNFEKFCDDSMLEIMKKAKMTAFGVSPIASYYVAKETEIKCLRIILSAKLSSVSNDIIRERMRELYV